MYQSTSYVIAIDSKKTLFNGMYINCSSRLNPMKNLDEFKNMLVQSTYSLILDKFKSSNMSLEKISNNSRSIIEINNEKIGIYKDVDETVYAIKPICTHLGCLLS